MAEKPQFGLEPDFTKTTKVIGVDVPNLPLVGFNGEALPVGIYQGEMPDAEPDQLQGLEQANIIMESGQTYAVGAQVDINIPGINSEDPFTKGWIITDIGEEVTTLTLPASHPGNTTGRELSVHFPSVKEQPTK